MEQAMNQAQHENEKTEARTLMLFPSFLVRLNLLKAPFRPNKSDGTEKHFP